MNVNAMFIQQKGQLFWVLHLTWSCLPLGVACWVFTDLGFEVWVPGAIVLLVGGYFYHWHASAVCARTAFERIGDVQALMAEQRVIEMAATMLSENTDEASHRIRSTRDKLMRRFLAAAPHIRSAWFWSCVVPGLIASIGFGWWLCSSKAGHAFPVAVAVVISFVFMTAQFLFRSPLMAAEGYMMRNEKQE